MCMSIFRHINSHEVYAAVPAVRLASSYALATSPGRPLDLVADLGAWRDRILVDDHSNYGEHRVLATVGAGQRQICVWARYVGALVVRGVLVVVHHVAVSWHGQHDTTLAHCCLGLLRRGVPVAQVSPDRAAPAASRWSAPPDVRPGPGWRGLVASGAPSASSPGRRRPGPVRRAGGPTRRRHCPCGLSRYAPHGPAAAQRPLAAALKTCREFSPT